MTQKRPYIAPLVNTEVIKIGVFGRYGVTSLTVRRPRRRPKRGR